MDQLTKDLFFVLLQNRRANGKVVYDTNLGRNITDVELCLRDSMDFIQLINRVTEEKANESKSDKA